MLRFTAANTVEAENMRAVYDTSHHLIRCPLRCTGLRSAAIHWKNSMTTIPRKSQKDRVSTDKCGCRNLSRTIENRVDERSREMGLLVKVLGV